MNERRYQMPDSAIASAMQAEEVDKAIRHIKDKINAAVKSGYRIENFSQFKDLVERTEKERNANEKIAYQMLIDFLKPMPEAQVQKISDVLFGHEKGNILFDHVHDALKIAIKDTYLKIQKSADNGHLLDQSQLLLDLQKSYHADYFLGIDPVDYILNEITGYYESLGKKTKPSINEVKEEEKKLEQCLIELKIIVYQDMVKLLNELGVSPDKANNAKTLIFSDGQKNILEEVRKGKRSFHRGDTSVPFQLDAYIAVAESLGLTCKIQSVVDPRELPESSTPPGAVPIPVAMPAYVMPAPLSENSTPLKKAQHVLATIKAAEYNLQKQMDQNTLKNKSKKAVKDLTFSKFAVVAVLVILLFPHLLLAVPATAMFTKVKYGSFKFWSDEALAKAATKRSVAKFKKETKKIMGKRNNK